MADFQDRLFDPRRLVSRNVMVDPQDWGKLQALAIRMRSRSVSAVVRRAIAELLEKNPPAETADVIDLGPA